MPTSKQIESGREKSEENHEQGGKKAQKKKVNLVGENWVRSKVHVHSRSPHSTFFFLPIAPNLASPHFIIIKINAWDCHDRRLSHLIVIKNSFNFIFRSSPSTLTPPCLVDSTAAKYLCRVNRLQNAMEIRWSDARWSRARGKAKRILKCAKFVRKGAKQIIRSTFN